MKSLTLIYVNYFGVVLKEEMLKQNLSQCGSVGVSFCTPKGPGFDSGQVVDLTVN